MKQYDPNIHHRRSIRLKGYDYSQMGVYFITICCQDRTCLFGDVVDGEMVLNEYGRIALEEWIKTTTIRPNVELREFVIMPNHIHAIIRFIGEGESHSPNGKVELRTPENLTDAFNTPQPSSCTCLNDQRRGESHSPNENENLCAPIERGECNLNQQRGECNSNQQRGECNSNQQRGECNSNQQRGECNSNQQKGECNSNQQRGECNSNQQRGECNSNQQRGECNSNQQKGECNSNQQRGECNLNQQRGECNSNQQTGECNSPLRGPSQTVGAVVRGYKSAVTKKLNELGIGCAVWQRNYYEHIIRNEQSYINIAEYIIKNPAKWQEDRFYRG